MTHLYVVDGGAISRQPNHSSTMVKEKARPIQFNSITMTDTTITEPTTEKSATEEKTAGENDFVIRDGFPALRLPTSTSDGTPKGGVWMIEGQEPLPRASFWAGDALEYGAIDTLRSDCELVFSARAKESDQAYSAGVTYFLPCQMKPTSGLEALVLEIFNKHTKDLPPGVMIPEQSGAEWWTLVMDEDEEEEKAKAIAIANKEAKKGGDDDEEDDEEEDEEDEVGLHFDADYGLEDQCSNLLLHPRLATVTYLSDYGAPTAIFQKQSPRPNESVEGPITKGWLSHPRIGKHVAFDGRLLHGAPATFFPPLPTKLPGDAKRAKHDTRRITLLVNLWINHCPLDAEPLDEDLVKQLKMPIDSFQWKTTMDLNKSADCTKATLTASTADPAGEEEFVLCSRLVTAKYGATMEDFHEASQQGELVELDLGKGVLLLEVGDLVEEEDEEEEEEEQGGDADENDNEEDDEEK
jgi:hypothetical protein